VPVPKSAIAEQEPASASREVLSFDAPGDGLSRPLLQFNQDTAENRGEPRPSEEGLCITNLTSESGFESGFSTANDDIVHFRSRQITRSLL